MTLITHAQYKTQSSDAADARPRSRSPARARIRRDGTGDYSGECGTRSPCLG